MFGTKKLLVAHVGKELKQEVIEAASVEESDRLKMQTKLEPSDNLDDFLQGADASGECDKRIGELRHAMLALVHGLDGYQFRELPVCAFLGNHGAGDHANDFASGCQCSVRQRAHQTNAAAAIDDDEAATGAR